MIPFTLSWTVLVESHGSLNISRAILGPRGFHVIPCSGDPSAWLVGGEIFFAQHGLLGQVFPCIVFAVQSVIVLWIKDSILQIITPFFVMESFCLSSHLSQILPSGKLT